MRNPLLREDANILTIAEVTWGSSSATTLLDIYLDYYLSDVYNSSSYASCVGDSENYQTQILYAHDVLEDNWTVKFSCLHTFGSNLAIASCNLTFGLW